jgi:hypothetical protein
MRTLRILIVMSTQLQLVQHVHYPHSFRSFAASVAVHPFFVSPPPGGFRSQDSLLIRPSGVP